MHYTGLLGPYSVFFIFRGFQPYKNPTSKALDLAQPLLLTCRCNPTLQNLRLGQGLGPNPSFSPVGVVTEPEAAVVVGCEWLVGGVEDG